MWKRLEKQFYITEDKFGIEDYRLPIVWVDKLLVVGGITASVLGRVAAAAWVVAFVMERGEFLRSIPFLLCGVLVWGMGEYFMRTGNRGLIYHHMDLLTGYLDTRSGGRGRCG